MARFAEFDDSDDDDTVPERYSPMRPTPDRQPLEVTVIDAPVINSEFDGSGTIRICCHCLAETHNCTRKGDK